MVSWQEIYAPNPGKLVYRVCSDNIAWRPAYNFSDFESALFDKDGAYNLFHSYSGLRVEEQRDIYVTPHFCAAWIDDKQSETALLITGSEIALVQKNAISGIDHTNVRGYRGWTQEKRVAERMEAERTKKYLDEIFEQSQQKIALDKSEFLRLGPNHSLYAQQTKVDLTNPELSADVVDDILNVLNIEPKKTESLSVAKSRIGQGEFRDALIHYWKACSVTGCTSLRLLKASHIKPWSLSSDQERLDVYNGLLLVPGIDSAFDLGLITFFPDGKGVISEALSVNDRMYLGILREDIRLASVSDYHIKYLKFHNEYVFESWEGRH